MLRCQDSMREFDEYWPLASNSSAQASHACIPEAIRAYVCMLQPVRVALPVGSSDVGAENTGNEIAGAKRKPG